MFNYAEVIDGVKKGDLSTPVEVNSPELVLVKGDMPAYNSKYENGVFLPPMPLAAIRFITPYAMRDRFTFEERVAIKSSADPRVQTFYDDLSLRKRLVNLDSERFALAMQLLLSEKLIAVGREVKLLRDGSPDEQN